MQLTNFQRRWMWAEDRIKSLIAAPHTLVRLSKQAKLRSLRGKLDWKGDLNAMRRDC